MLRLGHDAHLRIVAHVLDGLPLEACGLLAGTAGDASGGEGRVAEVYPCRNAAESAKVYEVDSLDYLHADRDADSRGLRITGVYHSHTHTDAYPSPTDVGQAPDPTWHYVVVSLRAAEPVMRSFRIVDGTVSEEPVALDPR
ncbi:MAG: M67 family metallopeptidase [Actinomycetota bacterium]|nr:M67 family metallopeptidase [Actinomycetota bacterium]MDQ6910981.1 M67 family metallopeptidase [Actinomycetota bacterium]